MYRILALFLVIASLAIWTTGCGTPKPVDNNKPDEHAEHDHPGEGPHKGHVIEFGTEEYHAELVHDDATKTVSIYILDSTAAKTVPIAVDSEVRLNLVVDGTPQSVELKAAPQERDPENQSSHFSITDLAVFEALEAPKTTGRLSITINGKQYSGAIELHEHDEKK